MSQEVRCPGCDKLLGMVGNPPRFPLTILGHVWALALHPCFVLWAPQWFRRQMGILWALRMTVLILFGSLRRMRILP